MPQSFMSQLPPLGGGVTGDQYGAGPRYDMSSGTHWSWAGARVDQSNPLGNSLATGQVHGAFPQGGRRNLSSALAMVPEPPTSTAAQLVALQAQVARLVSQQQFQPPLGPQFSTWGINPTGPYPPYQGPYQGPPVLVKTEPGIVELSSDEEEMPVVASRKRGRSMPSASPSPRSASPSGKSGPKGIPTATVAKIRGLLDQALGSVAQAECIKDVLISLRPTDGPEKVLSSTSLLSEDSVQDGVVDSTVEGGDGSSSEEPDPDAMDVSETTHTPPVPVLRGYVAPASEPTGFEVSQSDVEATGYVARIALLKATLLGGGHSDAPTIPGQG